MELHPKGTSEKRSTLSAALQERLSEDVKCRLIWALNSRRADEAMTQALIWTAEHDDSAHIRAVAVRVLGRARSEREIREALVRRLNEDKSEDVRAAAVHAIAASVKSPEASRAILARLESETEPQVVAASVMALGDVLRADGVALRRAVERYLDDRRDEIRSAAIWAMGPLERERTTMAMWDKSPKVAARAAFHVATWMCEGTLPWNEGFKAHAVELLWKAPFVCPCCRKVFWDLLDASEMRGEPRDAEALIGEAIEPWDSSIDIAFIYGSVARDAATAVSDLDLFVVGTVRLADMAEALRRVSETLDRPVNPVVRTREEVRHLFDQGSPFIHEVLRGEKIFVKGGDDELAILVGERVDSAS
jgi:predicted nucleotidyltransferase